MEGYRAAPRHQDLYRDCVFPMRPNVLTPAEVVKSKPAWAEAFELRKTEKAQLLHKAIHSGGQEEVRLRACMMAAVDEGVGMLFETLERTGQLDNTIILFLGDNGYFFGEHGLGPDRRFAYEEGIRSPLVVRYPPRVKAGSRVTDLVILQDIAPTLLQLAGGRPGPQVQGRSLLPLLAGKRAGWRKSFLIEYWAENAMPWLVGMTYKAVRTDALQVHPLGQPRARRRARRAVRPGQGPLRGHQRDPAPRLSRHARQAAARAAGLVADALGL